MINDRQAKLDIGEFVLKSQLGELTPIIYPEAFSAGLDFRI